LLVETISRQGFLTNLTAMAEKKTEDYFAVAPPKRSGWESFKLFLWNGETSELLGRTASSWVKIFAFYVVLYAFLAAFFAAMLLVFFQTLDLYQPRWQNANGLIGTNPGENVNYLLSDTFPTHTPTDN